ncbi:Fc.00g102840.m01.CDS01 [Cosmosporella sp. VM-42]
MVTGGDDFEEFADYCEHNHLRFISTLVQPLPIHERSYPLDGNPITPSNQPREALFSFDCVTAVIFDAQSNLEAGMTILSYESIRRQAETDEGRFTQTERRAAYVAEVEGGEAPEYKQLADLASASAVHVLQISRRRPGIDRVRFKTDHKAEISASEALPGELRHMRYYLLLDHPFSYSRGAWGGEPRNAMDVVHDITFHSKETAEQGIEILRAMAQKSKVICEPATVMFYAHRASEIRNLSTESRQGQEE